MENDKDLLLVAMFTTLTVVMWVTFELVKTSKTTTVANPVQKAIAPFSPKVDTDMFTILSERRTYE